jgi:hypothetical protein
VRVGVAEGGTGVGVGVGVAVGGTAVGVGVGTAGVGVEVVTTTVGVVVGGTTVGVGVGAAVPFTIVKLSAIAPVSLRNFASSWFPSTSSTIEPRLLSEMNIAGWLSVPPLAWPELPATA